MAEFRILSTILLREVCRFVWNNRLHSITLFEAQRGPPQDLVKNVPNDANFKVILTGFGTLVKSSVLVPHPMLSVQSSRRNSISGIELWRNRPFSVELLGFWFEGFLVRSSTAFMQNPSKLHENVRIKVRAPTSWSPKGSPTRFSPKRSKWRKFESDFDKIGGAGKK